MSENLYMIEMPFSPSSLISFLQLQGHNTHKDENLGYGVHAWLSAAFGPLRPKPFRLFMDKERPARILAYSQYTSSDLKNHLKEFGTPSVLNVCEPESIASKTMPKSLWRKNRQFSFEVLICPISRNENVEKDVYLRYIENEGEDTKLDRGAVYANWLGRQLNGGATINTISLESFRLVNYYRGKSTLKKAKFIKPEALMRGTMRITDEKVIQQKITRGIGRHRAFGYGMLLLGPLR